MSTSLLYRFEWDANKARSNQQKHGVSFPQASSVFHDALAITVYDTEHSDDEQRWCERAMTSSDVEPPNVTRWRDDR